MRLGTSKSFLGLIFCLFCLIQCEFAASYKNEIEITPAPIEEETTQKSGFFSGFKNFFRGSSATTTTTTPYPPVREVTASRPQQAQAPSPVAGPTFGSQTPQSSPQDKNQRPPPFSLQNAPLMPLGPRPDTPPSSPLAGNQQQPPQWPQTQQPHSPQQYTPSHQNVPQQPGFTQPGTQPAQSGLPRQQYPQYPQPSGSPFGAGGSVAQRPGSEQLPGFAPYKPPKAQPSGFDLSYGGAGPGGRPQSGSGRPSMGLAPLTSSTSTTTTTTTTTTPRSPAVKEDYPSLPTPRRPSISAKEDFPPLPVPKSPSPTPSSPSAHIPSSPSVWGSSTPTFPQRPGVPSPTTPTSTGSNQVAFVPHTPSDTKTTTIRPGVQSSGSSLATDDEIYALTETLYTKEVNSQLNMIRVNLQGKTRSIDRGDEAPQPLLEVSPHAFEAPTIAKMRLLFNNYEQDTLTNEHVTPNERKEENDFLDAVMATSVMRQAMLFLQNKGLVSPDPKTHRDLVKELWFTQYSRGMGKIGSSGFEHVFVHEVKNGTLIGLHNWVYFADEEAAGRLDYKGYLKYLDVGTKGKVLKVRFTHDGVNKPVNDMFVGTSPELELALYTVCFKLRPDRTCPVSLDNKKFGVVTYSWRYRGKSLIGSAFPDI